MARIHNIYRRAREIVSSAQTFAALTARLDPGSHTGGLRRCRLPGADCCSTMSMTSAGYPPIWLKILSRLRRAMHMPPYGKEPAFWKSSLSTLASLVSTPAGEGRRLMVANPNNWQPWRHC